MKAVLCKNQHGSVLVLTVLSMFVIMGMVGLAIDLGNGYVNKTELQNALDATALSAAISLDNNSPATAVADGRTTFDLYNLPINSTSELDICFFDNYTDINNTACPPPTINSNFVRATNTLSTNFTPLSISTFFASIIGFDNLNIGATAVSGPFAFHDACDLIPILGCATMTTTDGLGNVEDSDCFDDQACYGYNINQNYTLKSSDWDDASVGAGNFGLLDVGTGAADICEAFAGSLECTIIDETLVTQTGNEAGPTACLNIRFDDHTHGRNTTQYPLDQYPSDTIINSPIDYSEYSTFQGNGLGDPPSLHPGHENRRIVHMPFVDCGDGDNTGGSTLDVVGMGCFYITQKIIEGTNNPDKFKVFTEFLGDSSPQNPISACHIASLPVNSDEESEFAPQRIVLYKDPVSNDS